MSRADEKQSCLEDLLGRGMVMVHLDARTDGVDVPGQHRGNPALALNLSHRFGITDFRIDEEGVFASLSFGGLRYPCTLPWEAIFAMRSHVDESFHVWAEDVPAELVERAREAAAEVERLAEPEAEVAGAGEPPGRRTSVPYLRVVK